MSPLLTQLEEHSNVESYDTVHVCGLTIGNSFRSLDVILNGKKGLIFQTKIGVLNLEVSGEIR